MPVSIGPFSTGPTLYELQVTGSTVDSVTGSWNLELGPFDLTGIIRDLAHERVAPTANIKPITDMAINEVVIEVGDTMEIEVLKLSHGEQVLRRIRDTCTHIRVIWYDND